MNNYINPFLLIKEEFSEATTISQKSLVIFIALWGTLLTSIVIGGSATYFSLAASLYADVYLSAIVGDDFPKEMINTFKAKNINLDNFKIGKGNTFHWGGQYSDDLSSRETKFTNLGVFQNFDPKIINAK